MRRLFLGWAIAGLATMAPAWAIAGDQEVAQQIADNLKNSGKLKGYSISVKVQEGVVLLDGTVRSAKQLDDALSIAEVTPGIERVVSNLSVKSSDALAANGGSLRQPKSLGGKLANRKPIVSPIRQAGAELPDTALDQMPSPSVDTYSSTPAPVLKGEPVPKRVAAARNPRPLAQPAPTKSGNVRKASGMKGQPLPYAQMARANRQPELMPAAPNGAPIPAYAPSPMGGGVAPARFDHPHMPNYAWPSYAAYPNYAALTYPKQYSPTAWPFIGPFYPYPQVPLGWRKVSLEWDNGWWMLDFKD